MDDPLLAKALLLTVACFLCGAAGAAIGNRKHNPLGGFCMGFLLGPLGWLITLALPDHTLVECPQCKGRIPRGARKCQHCASDIAPVRENYRRRVKTSGAWPSQTEQAGIVIKTDCPHCDQPIEIPQELSEGKLTCPNCLKTF